MRRRRLLIGLAIVAAVVGVLVVWLRPEPRPEPTIDDQEFVAAANDLCRGQIPRLRADPTQNRREEENERETAERVERAAAGLAALTDDLADLPVDDDDEAEVDAWIAAWRDYVADGRAYAEAVRSKDAAAFSAQAEASRVSLRRVGRFARANRIDACIPR